MAGIRLEVAVALVGVALGLGSTTAPRQLTFEQRIEAQRAIEQVYYSHQIGARWPFEEAVSREILEGKVRTYLRKSAALESYWCTPITAEALKRELERIAKETHLPERLKELYAALGEDVFLIQETLVRQTLVERLTRSFFSADERIHGEAKLRAVRLREALAHREIDVAAEGPGRVVVDISREIEPPGSRLHQDPMVGSQDDDTVPAPQSLPTQEFENLRRSLPDTQGEPGAILDESGAYVVPVVLHDAGDPLTVADYRVDKTRWDDWWKSVEQSFSIDAIGAVASPGHPLPQPTLRQAEVAAFDPNCLPDHRWDNQSLGAEPAPPGGVRSVWTGNEVVYWGQRILSDVMIGWRYDPLTDIWSAMSDLGAPTPRVGWGMVWAGGKVLVWGGLDRSGNQVFLGDGARYDPGSDTWTPISMVNSPQPRSDHMMVWAGEEIVVWGGFGFDEMGRALPLANGGRYDAGTDAWLPISTAGAPAARHSAPAEWVDPYVVFWGGRQEPRGELINTGGRYDPRLDVWLPVSSVRAPSLRFGHRAVSTGGSMIVWGGEDDAGQLLNTGGRYDPLADSWAPTTDSGAPSPREVHGIVWTGQEMVGWGGVDRVSPLPLSTGARYDPETDTWTPTQALNAPTGTTGSAAVWTGSLMIVWPAVDHVIPGLSVVGRYDPTGDVWTLAPVGNGPSPRSRHTAVWTGTEMIVWGGVARPLTFLIDGARYDPVVDSWGGMSGVGGPQTSAGAVAVWTGQETIIWGAGAAPSPTRGGRYNPVQDTWRPISTENAPPPQAATAVWTGERMIVWGDGALGPTGLGTQYDPINDSWQPVSQMNAPSFRRGHSAVWTGSRMITWGGVVGSTNLDTGGQYDPETDTWTPTTTVDAPTPRENHTAVWTGDHMIVWGGELREPPFYLDTGGVYDPAADTWYSTSRLNAPSARRTAAVWTGNLMVIWGGRGIGGTGLQDTGGVYDPVNDFWVPLPLDGAPLGREGHSSMWTGHEMIIWGGSIGFAHLKTGGRYVPGNLVDADQDGFRGCDGDCDDSDSRVNPDAAEMCDGKDDDCDGVVPADEADADGDGFAVCAGDCDDSDASVSPTATELPGNRRDENCDGFLKCDPDAEWKNHAAR